MYSKNSAKPNSFTSPLLSTLSLSPPIKKTQRIRPPKTSLTSPPPNLQYSLPLHSKTLTSTSPLKFEPNPKPHSDLHSNINNSKHCLAGTKLVLNPKRCPNVVAMSKSPNVEDQKFSQEGLVTESLPDGMFKIRLDNADNVIGYISGKIRKNFVRILTGDRVKVEVSRYDTTRGRIVYRYKKDDKRDYNN